MFLLNDNVSIEFRASINQGLKKARASLVEVQGEIPQYRLFVTYE